MHAKKWTSSLKLVVILAQCRYTKTVQRIFQYLYNTRSELHNWQQTGGFYVELSWYELLE